MPALPPRDDRDLRTAFAREARLYGLGLVCATPAALAVWRTGSLWVGVLVFLTVLGVAGSGLLLLERRLRTRRLAESEQRRDEDRLRQAEERRQAAGERRQAAGDRQPRAADASRRERGRRGGRRR